ncbi:MAG: hypothetical protein EP344_15180 [Bacteroidetes bacterium]|nr:MAG: hypothetical protein EP344_15180 [Bacteroidota bacterium]
MLRFLLFLLIPALVHAQPAPDFRGKPFMAEEASYELDAAGNPDRIPRTVLIYRFDTTGRLSEHWLVQPGMTNRDKMAQTHTIHEYNQDGRILKSTEYDAAGKLLETLEHSYNASGALVRINKNGPRSLFNYEMDVRTDSLERINRIHTRYKDIAYPEQITNTLFTGDTLVVSTNRDTTGKLLHTWVHHRNQQSDPVQIIQEDEGGAIPYQAHYSYRYDETGNWVERTASTRSILKGDTLYTRTLDIRRIVYQVPVPDTLAAPYLEGKWADFMHGIQLDFHPDGTYLAFVWGQRQDGGTWTLDTRRQILSITGKEHRETTVELPYKYRDGIFILYRPGKSGEAQLVKLP